MIPAANALSFVGYQAPPQTAAPSHVDPMDVYPIQHDSLAKGDGWAGINKPVKVANATGETYVAKNNDLGAFKALHPVHSARSDNVHEIVASHIVADEFGLPSLTFQEGYLVADGQRYDKVLSKLQTDFKTLEEAPVTDIKNGDTAVALTVVDGWMGDWDSTFNDSNVWVRSNGQPMGSDYGYALEPGIKCDGVPFANVKIMKQFATKENVAAITDKITGMTDQQIHDMVQRVGSKWIHDWNPDMEKEMSGTLITNRDALRQSNPYLAYVEGCHPLLKGPFLKVKYPHFFYKASHAQLPPLNRPDQHLDVIINVAKYARLHWVEKMATAIRKHVHSPEEKAAAGKA